MNETMDNQHTLEVDLSWLAAAIEGEGCITIERSGKERLDGGRCLLPSTMISNTNSEFIFAAVRILDRIEVPFRISVRTRDAEKGWKTANVIRIRGQKAVEKLIPYIEPYLRSKKGQLQLVKRFIESRRKYDKPKGVPYTEYERSLVQDVHKLNQRGVRDCTLTTGQPVKDTVHSHNESVGLN